MWFKNLILYRLPAPWGVSAAELQSSLQQRTLQPCTAFDLTSHGWVPPAHGDRLLQVVNGQYLLALGTEQKILPAALVKQVVTERAAALADEQGYPCGRRQMRELKERVADELKAKAFSLRSMTRAWVDPANGWLVIDATSGPRAEQLLETLRDTLGSLPARFVETAHTPAGAMAAWLQRGEAPSGFTIEQDLHLQSFGGIKAAVRYSHHDLDIAEVREHIATGKQVTRLGLTWRDRISFALTDRLQIKAVQHLEIREQPDQELSAEDQFQADFALMAGEFSALLADLATALGGMQLVLAEAAPQQPEPDEEPLYGKAVALVRDSGKASVSFLQRSLSIGYNRAARIVESMEAAGIVGHMQPDGTRAVLAEAA